MMLQVLFGPEATRTLCLPYPLPSLTSQRAHLPAPSSPSYLMVAVGCLYIKSREAPPQDVLKDLVEMCKVRGRQGGACLDYLLRAWCVQVCRWGHEHLERRSCILGRCAWYVHNMARCACTCLRPEQDL